VAHIGKRWGRENPKTPSHTNFQMGGWNIKTPSHTKPPDKCLLVVGGGDAQHTHLTFMTSH